jgi:hypothetical protein
MVGIGVLARCKKSRGGNVGLRSRSRFLRPDYKGMLHGSKNSCIWHGLCFVRVQFEKKSEVVVKATKTAWMMVAGIAAATCSSATAPKLQLAAASTPLVPAGLQLVQSLPVHLTGDAFDDWLMVLTVVALAAQQLLRRQMTVSQRLNS